MIARRLEEVRRSIIDHGLQAIIVSFLPHVRYLTGFSGSSGLCVITSRRQFFVTDPRYRDQAREEVQNFRTVITSSGLFEATAKAKLLAGLSRVWYQAQYLTVAAMEGLRHRFPRIRFSPAPPVIEDLVAVKDESEIQSLRKAAAITDSVFQKLLGIIGEGVAENEVGGEISLLHRRLGAEADAFEPIVASGPRGALPHARASTRKIRKGELVVLDFGCRVNGYHSDLTRTVAVGTPPAEMAKAYSLVQDAQARAVESCRSGMRARSLDAIARKHISSGGFGRFFTHSLGHGLGLEVHERPRVSKLSEEVLVEGNVLTVEPGVYLPGLGGVRIEDDVVVHEDGCELLTNSPRDLTIL